MPTPFTNLLDAVVAPIVLISGVGLLLPSLINRFTQVTTLIRSHTP